MAVKITNNSTRLNLAQSSISNATIAGWVRRPATTPGGDDTGVMGGLGHSISFNTTTYKRPADSAPSPVVLQAVGEWMYLAIVKNGGNVSYYGITDAETGDVAAIFGPDEYRPSSYPNLDIGDIYQTYGIGWTNAEYCHFRAWSSVLTTAQLNAEKNSETPVIESGLLVSTSFASSLNSESGSNWTNSGAGYEFTENLPLVLSGGGGGSVPTITDAGDEAFYDGETGVVFTGTNIDAAAATLILSPTDDPEDEDAVAQTVTGRTTTSITATIVRGALPLDTNLYAFVINGDDSVNASGYVVQIQTRVFVREILIDKFGAPVASESGIVMLVWRQAPTTGAPNPSEALTVSTDGAGNVDQAIARGALAINDPVLVAFYKSGSPVRAGIRSITPDYE